MPAAILNLTDALTIEQGSTYDITLQLHQTDLASAVVDLTGYSARMQIRKTITTGGAPEIDLLSSTAGAVPGSVAKIVLGGAAGTVRIFIPDAMTAAFTSWSTGVYDLELVRPDGTVARTIQGSVAVSPEVTR